MLVGYLLHYKTTILTMQGTNPARNLETGLGLGLYLGHGKGKG